MSPTTRLRPPRLLVALNKVQTHTFHMDGDQDWVTFDAVAGSIYTFQTATELTASTTVDTVLWLFDCRRPHADRLYRRPSGFTGRCRVPTSTGTDLGMARGEGRGATSPLLFSAPIVPQGAWMVQSKRPWTARLSLVLPFPRMIDDCVDGGTERHVLHQCGEHRSQLVRQGQWAQRTLSVDDHRICPQPLPASHRTEAPMPEAPVAAIPARPRLRFPRLQIVNSNAIVNCQ